MPSTCLGVAQELHKYFYFITQRLHYIYGRALEGNKIINKRVNNLHEIKFHNKNVLKYVVLEQKYLRCLLLLMLCANDAEIYRKLQDNFKEQVKKPLSFYEV